MTHDFKVRFMNIRLGINIYINIILLLTCCNICIANSQVEKQDVGIISVHSYGEGQNESDAIRDALRQAIETTLGAYLVSNTLVNESKLVFDEIMTMSYGNIQKYNIKNKHYYENSVKVELEVYINKEKLSNDLNKIFKVADDKNTLQLSIRLNEKIDQVKKAERIVGFLSEKIQSYGYEPYIDTYKIIDIDASGVIIQLSIKFKLNTYLWDAYFDALNYASIDKYSTSNSSSFKRNRDDKFFCRSSSDDYNYLVYESLSNKCLERTHLNEIVIGDRYVNISNDGYSVFYDHVFSSDKGSVDGVQIRIKLNNSEEINSMLKSKLKITFEKTFYQNI